MMTPIYLTDARHGILSPAILKFQSGSLLFHNASNFSGENLRPSCIALVSIFFSAVVICSYTLSSPMDPPMDCQMLLLLFAFQSGPSQSIIPASR